MKNRHKEHVVLLHGLGRSSSSMQKLARAFTEHGYRTHNIDYPSTKHGIQALVKNYVEPEVAALSDAKAIHFITHSLGGILVRLYLQNHTLPIGSRIVMLAPPNHGSEAADYLRHWKLFQWLNGPALQQLGTGTDSVPLKLRPIDCEAAVITGTRGYNLPTRFLISGPNDGLVSVDSARLDEMRDFLVLPVGHTFVMMYDRVINQALYFIENGKFKRN